MNIRNVSIFLASALILSGSALLGKVIKISSTEQYNRHYTSDKPMVTMYSADGCGPCKMMKPLFHGAAEATSDITFALVDTGVKGLSGIAKGIKSLPTMIFSHKGTPVKREIGSRSRTQLNRHITEFRTQITSKKAPKKEVQKTPQKTPKAPEAASPSKTKRKRVITAPNPRPRRKRRTAGSPAVKVPAKPIKL